MSDEDVRGLDTQNAKQRVQRLSHMSRCWKLTVIDGSADTRAVVRDDGRKCRHVGQDVEPGAHPCARTAFEDDHRALRGIRENVKRMPAIGSDHRRHLQTVYAISAAIAGVAGALLTQTTDTVSLDVLSFSRSADVVVMLILGGTGRLYGGIVGAIILLVARDQLAGINPQYWYFWIGLLLMVVVLVMPGGILGGLSRLARGRA